MKIMKMHSAGIELKMHSAGIELKMHSAGIEPATINLEGCCSKSTELRMHF